MTAQPEVTTAQIKELRERTGVGMGKCKEALVAAHGDVEEAIAILRKAGIASAVKKEGRSTNEGMIVAARTEAAVALLEGNAETDFVVRNDRFQNFLRTAVQDAAQNQVEDIAALLATPYSQERELTVDQYRATLVQAIGENIQLRRLKLLPLGSNVSLGLYSHLDGKIMTAVVIEGSDSEEALARDIAMHAAAAAPDYLAPSDVPEEMLTRERDVAATQMQGKPANMLDKIVEGKLNAFYDGVCLLRQKYIKNDAVTIQQLVDERAKVSGKPLTVRAFVRWSVGS
jgi:elongation factor Ts